MNKEVKWWQNAIFYQIYPRSFFDSDGDGEGDLAGITAKLDYIQSLGVDAIWSCPYFVSPKADNGYDVADYCAIDPSFGTMDDWKKMSDEIHRRGMRFFMDLVVNHTSDEHEWFKSARASKDSPYRDYYLFRDGKPDGKEPSNWQSIFGGSAWEYNKETNDYYLHLFAVKQPDLNWENPKVLQEVEKVMNFWAEIGVDGFRMDAFNNCDKDQTFPDVPTEEGQPYGYAGQHYISRPGVTEAIKALNKDVIGPKGLATVVELAACTDEKMIEYGHPDNHEFDMLYLFDMLGFDQEGWDKFAPIPFHVTGLKEVFDCRLRVLHGNGTMALFIGNHDQPRPVSRFGAKGELQARSAKTIANAIYFLEGVPYIYQGEELGLPNAVQDSIEDYDDVEVKNIWQQRVLEGGEDAERWLELFHTRSRDCSRAPMPWSDGEGGGFTTGKPWMGLGIDTSVYNVQKQEKDPDSVLHFYRDLVRVWHETADFRTADMQWIDYDSDDHMSYLRKTEGKTLLSLNNFKDAEVTVVLPAVLDPGKSTVLLGNCGDPKIGRSVTLRPWECMTVLFE